MNEENKKATYTPDPVTGPNPFPNDGSGFKAENVEIKSGGGISVTDGGPYPGELSFGQKAVGLTFNHGEGRIFSEVDQAKRACAYSIDQMNQLRNNTTSGEVKRLASVAITELQTAQMWMVKALTWKD